MKTLKTILKFLVGIAMLPVCYGYSVEFLKVISGIYQNPGNHWGLFLGGGATYLLIHIALPRPLLIHVFGHELTHAFFAKLFGWKVRSIKASSNGGQAKLSGSNFIVTLAPYFFPLYSFTLLFIYILTVLADYDMVFYPYFIFLAGFTLSLHILMTVESLKTSQPDIKDGGVVFSLPLIYIGNLITITLLLKLTVFTNIAYLEFLKMGLFKSWEIWKALFRVTVR